MFEKCCAEGERGGFRILELGSCWEGIVFVRGEVDFFYE